MERLFVDTSAWLPFVNRNDRWHAQVKETLLRFEGRLVTSNFVFDETVTLALRRLGHAAAVQVGDVLRSSTKVDVVRLDPGDEQHAWDLFRNRSDQTYSFTDCTSFVLLRRLKIGHVATLDGDFQREGFQVLPR